MSCNTLDSQITRLAVSAGALPEGFCPSSMQDLANAFAARLIVTPSANFAGVVLSSLEPSGNAGPWLKNCEEWFVWDDSLSRYVPITKQGFNTEEYFTASGTFVVPAFIYRLRVQCWGAGGGGGVDTGNVSAGGGGAGAYCEKILAVNPGDTINYTVGVGGTAGTPGTAGTATIFSTLTAGGGSGASGGANAYGVVGGTATGGLVNLTGQASFNGSSGFGGAGGSSPKGGGGGTYINPPNSLLLNGKAPGGGGSGDYASTGAGNGANGAIKIEY